MEPTSRPVITPRYRAAVLMIAVIGTTLGVIAEIGTWTTAAPGTGYRLLAYGLIGLTSGYQLLRQRRVEGVMAMAAFAFCTLSLTEAGRTTGFDSGNTLACLILILVVYVATRDSQSVAPLILASGLTATYTVASILLERPSVSEAAARLMIGIPGQAMVMWITWQLIQSLADASERQAKSAKIQKAMATCSQALLTGRDEEPLSAALEALLDATEADYSYIDVNRVDTEGNVTWEIVAEAMGADVPPGPDTSTRATTASSHRSSTSSRSDTRRG